MNLHDELLPQDAPLSDRFEQIGAWLRSMGYQVIHSGGCDDDTDFDVAFCPGLPDPNGANHRWHYHSDTRQGLAKSLVRHVWRWEG